MTTTEYNVISNITQGHNNGITTITTRTALTSHPPPDFVLLDKTLPQRGVVTKKTENEGGKGGKSVFFQSIILVPPDSPPRDPM